MLAALLLMAPVLTVDQVVARHGELNGQVIEVQGFLPRCISIDCSLLSTKRTPSRYGQRFGSDFQFLSIAGSTGLDRHVGPFIGHRVVLTARLNDECLDHPCVDRSDTLTPTGNHPLRLLGK